MVYPVGRKRRRGNAAIPPASIRCGADRAGRNGLFGGLRRQRRDRDEGAAVGAGAVGDGALDLGEEGVVAAHVDMLAGVVLGAALADDDVAGHDDLAAELLDAEAAATGIAPVARGAAGFLMRHSPCLLTCRP